MIKSISIDQVRAGMYLHALGGAWIDHPFWKKSFVIREPDLERLRASSVKEVFIDVSKGLDVLPAANSRAPAPPTDGSSAAAIGQVAPATQPATLPTTQPAPARSELKAEFQRATALVGQARSAVTSLFNEARLGQALQAENCLPLVDEISSSVARNPGAIISLARLKTHDDYTYMHSVAVCALMVSLARRFGCDEDQSREMGLAGMLHDIGKAAMPLNILNKPGKLTDAEYEVIKGHSAAGHQMLLDGNGVGALTLDVCLHHHERPDGKGYPHRLSGDALSRQARMGAVCDVYDAITSDRPYKAGWDPADAISKMASWKDQFDNSVFQAFVRGVGIYPIGSLLRLKSGRLAVVADQNPHALVKPVVKIFYSITSDTRIPPETVDLAANGCSEEILAREPAERWKFSHLNELWAGPENLRKLGWH